VGPLLKETVQSLRLDIFYCDFPTPETIHNFRGGFAGLVGVGGGSSRLRESLVSKKKSLVSNFFSDYKTNSELGGVTGLQQKSLVSNVFSYHKNFADIKCHVQTV